jgi:hypothetical protein
MLQTKPVILMGASEQVTTKWQITHSSQFCVPELQMWATFLEMPNWLSDAPNPHILHRSLNLPAKFFPALTTFC